MPGVRIKKSNARRRLTTAVILKAVKRLGSGYDATGFNARHDSVTYRLGGNTGLFFDVAHTYMCIMRYT
jgi:hypothetical protein